MLENCLSQNKIDIVLASGSPRRRELLAGMGISFRVAEAYPVDEVYPAALAVQDVPLYLAERKSRAFPEVLKEREILITADTVVIHGGRVIGKPAGREEAVETLRQLSCSVHEVVTGVMLRSSRAERKFSDTARVVFGPLTAEEIEYYVDRFRPYDKAGAYGIQEWIGYAGIERIEGSFYNVMGLPTRLLYLELSDFIRMQGWNNE